MSGEADGEPVGGHGRAERMADGYSRFVRRWRWAILLFWLIAPTVLYFSPSIGTGGDQLASIIPLDSPSIQAEVRSVKEFGFPLSSRTVVVQRDPGGLSPFIQAESVLDAIGADQSPQAPPLLGALPLTNALPFLGNPRERNTTVLTYLFTDPSSSFSFQQYAAQRYIAEHLNRPEDHVVGVTGSIPARAEQARLVAVALPRLELLTVAAVVLLVGITFRSVAAPLIALTASAIAFVVTTRLSAVIGGLIGVGAPAELEPLLVALLLGIVTDYTIFYLTALQSRAAETGDWRSAGTSAIRSTTPIVLAAGLTVAGGTAAMLVAKSGFFRGFGPAMALAVVVGMVVAVTLIPALLAVLGRLVFWPRRLDRLSAGHLAGRSRRWQTRLVTRLIRRRNAAIVLAVCVLALGGAALPLRGLDLGLRFTTSLPPDNSVARAAAAAADGFAPGITSPTTLLLEGRSVTDQLDQLARFQHLISEQPGVAGVIGPAQNVSQRVLGVFLARTGDAARMLLVLDSDPLDARAINTVTGIRSRLPAMMAASGLSGVTVSIAGDTALAEGLVSSTQNDLLRIAIAALAVNLLLLVLFLRALVAPLYLLASSVLALTASLGLTVWVFMDLQHYEGLTFYVPFAASVLLVALGSDYNIFGVGSIWEQARRHSLRDSIIIAVPDSSRAIGAAGLTLAVSFAMLAVIPLSPFRELAFAMAVGIVLDAIIVRSLVMPALLALVGDVSAWPSARVWRRARN